VISTFALSDISGATPIEAVTIANYAAGRVCEEVGVVPISLDMLIDTIGSHSQVS
jgi:bifunctional ADP-heptose synthase (sugar kinase/adenylyltransferase)